MAGTSGYLIHLLVPDVLRVKHQALLEYVTSQYQAFYLLAEQNLSECRRQKDTSLSVHFSIDVACKSHVRVLYIQNLVAKI